MYFAKDIGKDLSSKYNKKLPDRATKSTADAIRAPSKRVIQKKSEATVDLIGNKVADKIRAASKRSSKELHWKNNLDKANNKISKEIFSYIRFKTTSLVYVIIVMHITC